MPQSSQHNNSWPVSVTYDRAQFQLRAHGLKATCLFTKLQALSQRALSAPSQYRNAQTGLRMRNVAGPISDQRPTSPAMSATAIAATQRATTSGQTEAVVRSQPPPVE